MYAWCGNRKGTKCHLRKIESFTLGADLRGRLIRTFACPHRNPNATCAATVTARLHITRLLWCVIRMPTARP
jgi:hypothetical protein